jgi:hypothetical protein
MDHRLPTPKRSEHRDTRQEVYFVVDVKRIPVIKDIREENVKT